MPVEGESAISGRRFFQPDIKATTPFCLLLQRTRCDGKQFRTGNSEIAPRAMQRVFLMTMALRQPDAGDLRLSLMLQCYLRLRTTFAASSLGNPRRARA